MMQSLYHLWYGTTAAVVPTASIPNAEPSAGGLVDKPNIDSSVVAAVYGLPFDGKCEKEAQQISYALSCGP